MLSTKRIAQFQSLGISTKYLNSPTTKCSLQSLRNEFENELKMHFNLSSCTLNHWINHKKIFGYLLRLAPSNYSSENTFVVDADHLMKKKTFKEKQSSLQKKEILFKICFSNAWQPWKPIEKTFATLPLKFWCITFHSSSVQNFYFSPKNHVSQVK